MSQTIDDPLFPDVGTDERKGAQEDFGRHLVEQRNRMAVLIRKWIETDKKFPIPIYDRVIDRIRQEDAALRADIASIALLMADQMVSAILITFAKGNEMRVDDQSVNYAIVAQTRAVDSDEVTQQVDINRGEPIIAIWKAYDRWLNRFAPGELRPSTSTRPAFKD